MCPMEQQECSHVLCLAMWHIFFFNFFYIFISDARLYLLKAYLKPFPHDEIKYT